MGGGSGGHITPIVAVINEIKRLKPKTKVAVWCDRKFVRQARTLLGDTIPVSTIPAGKLRRYANLPWWYKWFSYYHIVHTHIPNLIDGFRIVAGFVVSYYRLRRLRPDVVFCKGGYVCLPVGLAAHLLHIPLVLHDSDTVAGLTNRLLSRYATSIGTGAPTENYPYNKAITKYIGIPVRQAVADSKGLDPIKVKRSLGLSPRRPLVVAMGGGLGAREINEAMVNQANRLVEHGAQVVILAGRYQPNPAELASLDASVKVLGFTDKILSYMRAASVVVTRAGATTMAELAAMPVATIIVPSPYLAGDHQTKNAQVYANSGAAIVLTQSEIERHPQKLGDSIIAVLDNSKRRQQLAEKLHAYAQPRALQDMAQMIINAVK